MLQTMTSVESAEEAKKFGNEAFKEGKYEEALKCYLEAINQSSNPSAVYFSNASAAYSKLAQHAMAIEMASEALSRDPTQVKAYYRRGCNRLLLGELRLALADLKTCLRMAPLDPSVMSSLAECEKAITREAFAKAIKVPRWELSWDAIQAISVDATYQGPRFERRVISGDQVIALMEHFKKGLRLPVKYACTILLAAKELFAKEATVQLIPRHPIVTVCGDTHGQFQDVCTLFEEAGQWPSEARAFCFNGDLVDRGAASVEVFLTACAWKAAAPQHFFCTRGNHESESLNRYHGFFEELSKKFPAASQNDLFSAFNSVMSTLPLAHLVDQNDAGRFFVVHGGIPDPKLSIEKDLLPLNRFVPLQNGSLASLLLWSDPSGEPGIRPSHRGEGVLFGPDVTAAFCTRNGLKAVIRSHVWESTGYRVEHDGQCITIFSAPNYIPGKTSPGAFIEISEDNRELHFHQFNRKAEQQ